MNRLFGRQQKPEELVKKWRQNIRAQDRQLSRQVAGIDMEEAKVKKSIKMAAKRNDMATCKILAKEVLAARKQKDRILTSKAQLNSIMMQLQQQLATVKMAGALQKSADIMKMVNNLVKLPEISKAMMEMSQEMTKVGIMDEMIQDTMESFDEVEEEEAEEEVEKILFEVTDGLLGQAGAVGAPLEKPEEAEEEPLENMQNRLQALRQ